MYLDKESFKQDFKSKTNMTEYEALGSLVMDYMDKAWHETEIKYNEENRKKVYYFSLEYLIGRLMDSVLINLGIRDVVDEGLKELGISLSELEEEEPDAGLGNGGLGRLAACFLDSMASLGIAGTGMGIRYRYGLFTQEVENGYQIEKPDDWLKNLNVWERRKDEEACIVKFGGRTESHYTEDGKFYMTVEDCELVHAVPYDMPVPGYENGVVNTLRLWSTDGDIAGVLYPDDSTHSGKLLRLKQQYFFVSAGIQSILRDLKERGISLKDTHEYVSIQINDTHPSMAVPELMRILIDEEYMSWDEAWDITVKTISYTNHTILAEALEKWNADMLKVLLPRIYMIIEEINRRFTEDILNKYPGDFDRLKRMAIIQDNVVRMANLSIVGSHRVNGVAELHTDILKYQELKDFNDFYPGKICNKTNGISHRRWLMQANPELSALIDNTIGTKWRKEPLQLSELMKYTDDKVFLNKFAEVKNIKKQQLAKYISEKYHISVDESSIYDVQVKRLHMYKRQLLNIMHVMDLYNRLCDDMTLNITPRTFIFGAKAFPGYVLAKKTIKLICSVADKINRDVRVHDKIKVVFMPNYGVSLAQLMIPAGNISEQISTASMEASGTGNMKFMMNGAVTLATLDGANVEIHRAVGDDNIVLFGLRSDEVIEYRKNRNYRAEDVVRSDMRLQRIINQIKGGYFGIAPVGEFDMIIKHLIEDNDPYFVLKDFDSYLKAQESTEKLYMDKEKWNKTAAINVASSGVFSSDNTILKYASEIWNV